MKVFFLMGLFAVACPVPAAGQSHIHDWFAAKRLAESGKIPEAAERYRACFEKAVVGRDSNYAWPAASATAHQIYRQGKPIDAAAFAGSAYVTLADLPHPSPEHMTIIRAELLGMVERGHHAEGRIGAAWRTSRAIAGVLRGGEPALDDDAEALGIDEFGRLPDALRSLGLRLIERHADYLDLTGRSDEALAFLTAALESSGDWTTESPHRAFYHFKIICRRIELLDFLGHKAEAIERLGRVLAEAESFANRLPTHTNMVLQQRINLLRHRSQWFGPDLATLEEARQLGQRLIGSAPQQRDAVERLIALMEIDLEEAADAVETLASGLAGRQEAGSVFDALYFGRDHLFARAAEGEVIPDSEFAGLLAAARAQGNKRAEPTLYTDFARHLARQNRHAEAEPLLRHALRLVRSTGRPLHQYPILALLLDLAVDSGDPAATGAALAELERALAQAPDPPQDRIVATAPSRARALAFLGRKDSARELFATLRAGSGDLPDWKTRWLAAEIETAILDAPPIPADPRNTDPAGVRLSPLAIASVAEPGGRAETRFMLENPSGTIATGALVARGPGARFDGATLVIEPDRATAEARLALTLAPGAETAIPARATAAASGVSRETDLSWSENGTPTRWTVTWDPEATAGTVLDASLLDAGPFRSLVLCHRVSLPAGTATGAFRLVSPVPLRLEYYDPGSGRLLAVDAEGDGDFTGRGDWAPSSPAAPAAVPLDFGSPSLIEIRIHPAADAFAAALPITLRAEVFRDGAWGLEAEDILR